jgi:sulfite exporter TauE/SafE
MIWGWLPCGLVYSVLLWTLSSVDALKGGMYMFMFGLGTLPSMLFTGMASNAIIKISSLKSLRITAGLLIIFLGLASVILQLGVMNHADENTPSMKHSHH